VGAAWPEFARSVHFNEVTSDGGLVVAPDPHVADAGASVLRAGGNAVDAAVAAAFAEGVVESPMSGLGGSATMTVATREPDRVAVIEGHMVVPSAARAEDYPLAGKQPERRVVPGGWSVTFFDQPLVEGAVNLIGPKAVATPGFVACVLTAHERFGRLPRAQVLEPAIKLAAEGIRVSWYVAACIASEARALAHDPGCAELFLPKGLPLRGPVDRPGARLVQPALARTLEMLAAKGADVFYRGEVGASIVRTVRAGGGALDMADLERYQATVIESPPPARYGPYTMIAAPVSGFPTVVEALNIYAMCAGQAPRHDDAVAWARALKLAMTDRFLHMTADESVRVPWAALRSPAYARARLDAELNAKPPPDPHMFSSEGTEPMQPAGRPGTAGHTSQISAVDDEGNLVSLTSTILAEFGARVLDPDTGVVLNNGIGYFDPRPNTINSIRPGVQVLSAMTPLILSEDGRGPVAALGASGGWRIISGVAQMVAALANGLSLQQAVEQPRIHAETNTVLLDVRWPREAASALEAAGFTVEPVVEEPTTVHFARPNGVIIDRDGTRRSGVDPKKPGGAARA
jgi:gamma-glutamyltranspeptidase / glutathione hydrolase